MRILIVYASKTGTTERCAGILGQNLKRVKDFISSVLTGLSIGEMLVGIYVAMKSVAKQ